MKTLCNFLRTTKLVPLVLVSIFGLFIVACQDIYDPNPVEASEEIVKESFLLTPAGTKIIAFSGTLEIDFPAGVIGETTYIDIFSYSLSHVGYYNHNMMKRGFGIEIGDNQLNLLDLATLRMKFNLNEFMDGVPESEGSLTIYRVYPDVYYPTYIVSLGECCVDGSCQMISSCIEKGGNFIVGVK
ncbi:MAG: hypothetical protein ABFS38_12580 [Bacteroidota bacterium]